MTWSVQGGEAGGTITEGGLYTAPYAAGSFHVLARASDGASASATVAIAPSITLLAGHVDGYVDGPAADARFRHPTGSAVDAAGNLYVSDRGDHVIRKVSVAGVVTTFAGMAGVAGSADGTGAAARFSQPNSTAVDAAGNLYVADYGNHTVRIITPAGVVTTLAGLAGVAGSRDGTGADARFNGLNDVAVGASGRAYVADTANQTIRVISPIGVVTTLAGASGLSGSADGAGASARFAQPAGVAVDRADNVYVADYGNHTVRKVTPTGVVSTVAGSAGLFGNVDGAGSAARFYAPSHLTVDAAENLYVADLYNHAIRKITATGMVTTVAGYSAGLYTPCRVSEDKRGNLFVAEYENAALRKITPDGVVSTVAGLPLYGVTDGVGAKASFHDIGGIAVDKAGNAYVADEAAVRKITPAGLVTSWAGKPGVAGSANGSGTDARFYRVLGIAADDDGGLVVSDPAVYIVKRISPTGVLSNVAGLVGNAGSSDGLGAAARFQYPAGVALDATGKIYVADYGSHTVRAIAPNGAVTTLAGLAGTPGHADGRGENARFLYPFGLAVDPAGNVLVADEGNQTIRRIDNGGAVSTFGGVAGIAGFADGTASLFAAPRGIAADAKGNVFVGEVTNRAVRAITRIGAVTTVAGNPTSRDITVLGSLPGSLRAVTSVAMLPSGALLATTQYAVLRIVSAR